jgi:hypothetical protein
MAFTAGVMLMGFLSARVGAALIQRRIGMQWPARRETTSARAPAPAPPVGSPLQARRGRGNPGARAATNVKARVMTKMDNGAGEGGDGDSPSRLIDARIEALGDWRGETLARIRTLIREADPEVVEEWKWRGVPVWSHGGIICTGETYKNVVKTTFAKGASLEDPSGLFNSSLEGNVRRAIDFHEGEEVDETAFIALIRAAAALNLATVARRRGPKA